MSIVISSKSGWDNAQILHVTSHGDGNELTKTKLETPGIF